MSNIFLEYESIFVQNIYFVESDYYSLEAMFYFIYLQRICITRVGFQSLEYICNLNIKYFYIDQY